jgi:hypothetical protein
MASVVTVDMIWSLALLLLALPAHREGPRELLLSAGALWITNILVFASWYWRLDAGGPAPANCEEFIQMEPFFFPR